VDLLYANKMFTLTQHTKQHTLARKEKVLPRPALLSIENMRYNHLKVCFNGDNEYMMKTFPLYMEAQRDLRVVGEKHRDIGSTPSFKENAIKKLSTYSSNTISLGLRAENNNFEYTEKKIKGPEAFFTILTWMWGIPPLSESKTQPKMGGVSSIPRTYSPVAEAKSGARDMSVLIT